MARASWSWTLVSKPLLQEEGHHLRRAGTTNLHFTATLKTVASLPTPRVPF
jgi:hypothetical protein